MISPIEAFPFFFTQELENKIILTKRTSLPAQMSDSLRERKILTTRRFLSGEVDLQVYKRETDTFDDPGVLLVQRPSDLRMVLALLGFEGDFIEESVSHEEKHWEMAQGLNFESKVGVRFVKVNRQARFRNVLTSIDIPEMVDEEVVRQALYLIITAPGENMSRGDYDRLPT